MIDLARDSPDLWQKINDAYLNDDKSILELQPVQAYRRLLLETKSWFVPGKTSVDDAAALTAALSPYEKLIFDEYIRVKADLNLEPYVELARTITGMQMSYIGVFTQDDDHCIARAGPGSEQTNEKYPRSHVLCHYTIQQPKGNTSQFREIANDWRLDNHPFNTGTAPGSIRSYIGIPLTTATGTNIGTLCCLDPQPRQQGWSAHEEQGLEILAELIMRDLDLQVDRSLAMEAKKIFVTSVNHELKTPVHGLLASAELLKAHRYDDKKHSVSSFEAQCISSIQHCSNTLIDVIDNVLVFSNSQTAQAPSPPLQNGLTRTTDDDHIAHSSVNLCQFVEHTVDSCWAGKSTQIGHEANSRMAIFNADAAAIERRLFVNRGELSRIILNIFGNAVKYTKVGYVLIDLECQGSTQDSDTMEVTIRFTDTGRGMSDKFVENGDLFKPFVQQDAKSEGVGLGLSICKSFVEKSRGSIVVKSILDVGTTITVRLPFKIDQEAREDTTILSQFGLLRGKTFALTADNPAQGASKLNETLLHSCVTLLGMIRTEPERADVIICQTSEEVKNVFSRDISAPCLLVASDLRAWHREHTREPEVSLVQLPLGPLKLARSLLPIYLGLQARSDAGPSGKIDLAVEHERPELDTRRKIYKRTKKEEHASRPSPVSRVDRDTYGETGAQGARPKVLCVDDNAINLGILATVVARQGVAFETADDGEQAVMLYKKTRPCFDLIFLDVNMPRLNGFETCQQIRKYEKAENLPPAQIIALSAGGAAQAAHCMKAGMNGYCDKPVPIQALAEMVSSWQSSSNP